MRPDSDQKMQSEPDGMQTKIVIRCELIYRTSLTRSRYVSYLLIFKLITKTYKTLFHLSNQTLAYVFIKYLFSCLKLENYYEKNKSDT